MRQLTSLDAQFLALEDDRTQGHVSALATYDPETVSGRRLDAALVRELVTDRLHLLPTFRWRLVQVPLGLDHPYWVDDPGVDVDYHVRELALPSPGDDRQLAEQVARIAARPLDRSRPLWEMYVIHGLHDGAVALLTKMHHAVVDGASGAEVMGVLLDETAEGRAPQRPRAAGGPARARQGRNARARPRRHLPLPLARTPRGAANAPSPRRHPDDSPHPRREDDRPHQPADQPRDPGRERLRRARGFRPHRPADALPGADLTAPSRRVRLALARRGQGSQERVWLHRQRRRHGDVREPRCAAGCPNGASCPTSRWSDGCPCPSAPRMRSARTATASR